MHTRSFPTPEASTRARDRQPIDAVASYVEATGFPCVGAKSAFHRKRVRHAAFGVLGCERHARALCAALSRFSREFPEPGLDPVSFIATFDDAGASEREFAGQMWRQLQALHEHDRRSFEWDPSVSADPEEPDFSFSVAGRAFFVVGLHPNASRLARRAPMPCLVFNFHDQFEALRTSGKYAGMQRVIRQRDVALQGSINPVLDTFGDRSEARQYSGAPVGEAWKCPFHAHETTSA